MTNHEAMESGLFTYINCHCFDLWSINPYRLCDHMCSYCISYVQGKSTPRCDTPDMLRLIDEFLPRIPSSMVLSVGGISDAYPRAEEAYGVTREIVKYLRARGRSFSVVTKGVLVERDADLFQGYERARVTFSFSTLDNDHAALYEPGTERR